MSVRRTIFVLIACLSALAITAAFAQAAKTPTYHVYKKCSSKYNCSGVAYLNKKQTRVIALQANKRCSDGSYASIDFAGRARISSKGKFTVTEDVRNFDVTAQATVGGQGTIKGKVKKGEKITLTYSLTHAPAACGKVAGVAVAKYKGTQVGG